MPDYIQGVQTTANIEQSQRVPDVDDKIYLLEAYESPLTAFLTQIGKAVEGGSFKSKALQKRVVTNPELIEFEDQYAGVWAQVNLVAGYADDATEIVVDNPGATIFTKYDLVKVVRTGEIMRVTSVNYSTHTLTVARGAGATAAAAILNNDYLYNLGPAFEEGSKSGDMNVTKLIKVTNYTQIFKTKFGVTGTQDATKNYPADAAKSMIYQRAKQAVEHAKKIERAYWFGEKKEGTGPDGKPLRLTGGVLEAIIAAGNVQDEASSSLTETEWRNYLRDYAFKYGSSEKYHFCGNAQLAYFDSIYAGRMVYTPNDKTFGVDIRRVQSPFGVINFVRHPMFDGQFAGLGVTVDLSSLKHCPLEGRDTELKTNIQDNDDDEKMDQFLTESGLQRTNMEKCAILKGVA